MEGLCEGAADAGDGCDFFNGSSFESLDGAEVSEEASASCEGDAGAVVEDAFFNAAVEEELVVGVGDAVGFVADALEHAEGAGVWI